MVALDQKSADKIILMIHRQIRDRIEPIIDYDISSIVIKNSSVPRYIIKVDVNANKNLPVALHDGGLLGIYVRNYGRTDLATQEQIRDLILMSDNTPFDTAFTDEDYNENDYRILLDLASKRNTKI